MCCCGCTWNSEQMRYLIRERERECVSKLMPEPHLLTALWTSFKELCPLFLCSIVATTNFRSIVRAWILSSLWLLLRRQ